MTTTQDSSRYEDPATTTWWLDTIGRGVWEEAILQAEGIDPADDDEWEQWEQVRWIGRVTIDDLAPDEMPFGGDVIVTGTDGFVLREVAAGRTVDLWVPVDRRGGPVDDTPDLGVTPMASDDTPVHSEDVTVSVTVRVTLCRPEEDRVYSVAKPGGERIHGYIRHRNDGWRWSLPTGGYPPVWTGPYDSRDAAIVGLLERS